MLKIDKNLFIQNKHGFTLIEFILYVAILSVVLVGIVTFMLMILHSRVKNQVISEVEQQGVQVMQIITQTIRNAEDINSPSPGSSASSLSIDVVTVVDDLTIFDLNSGVIRIKQGVASEISLTSDKITASGLNFQNIPRAGTADTIKIEFTLTYTNLSGDILYNYSQTFYGSASLRQ